MVYMPYNLSVAIERQYMSVLLVRERIYLQKYTVEFYEKVNGECPVEEFLNSLDKKMLAKLLGIIKILEEKGNYLREPYSKHLEEGIYELRGKIGNNITRVLYFFYLDGRIIMTNGFVKKTNKTPKKEILKAKRYQYDYMKRIGEKV